LIGTVSVAAISAALTPAVSFLLNGMMPPL
jgi:hypothetical protein